MIRDFKESDIKSIDKIFKNQPELGVPGLLNMITNATLEDDNGKIIGYGAVKLFSESILILDKSIPRKDKAKALREAMQVAILKSRDAGLEYLYAVSNDKNFTKVLQHNYGFRVVPGELLCLDITYKED